MQTKLELRATTLGSLSAANLAPWLLLSLVRVGFHATQALSMLEQSGKKKSKPAVRGWVLNQSLLPW